MTLRNCELGTALRRIRSGMNITQETAAEGAHMTDRSLRDIESGRSVPKLTTFAALCKFYGVALDSLAHLIPEPKY